MSIEDKLINQLVKMRNNALQFDEIRTVKESQLQELNKIIEIELKENEVIRNTSMAMASKY